MPLDGKRSEGDERCELTGEPDPTGTGPAAADTKEVMGEPTNAVLWQRAVAGDPDSFGELFERHSRSVYNYCFRRTGSWSQAEDLTSVVFLEAWRRRSDVRLEHERALRRATRSRSSASSGCATQS